MKLVKIFIVLLFPLIGFSQTDPPYPPSPSAAANVIVAEYYFDTDPGFGNGTSISVTSPSLDLSFTNVSLDISSLSTGVHTVFIRTQNADGEWSQTSAKTILVEPDYSPAPTAASNIVAAEYFTSGSGVGDDPGFGQASSIIVPSGQTDVTFSNQPISISGLANGINYLYVRTQNADGEWSQTSIKEFEIIQDFSYPSSPPVPTDIVAAEYFFDVDPGFGNGTGISITPGQDINISNLNIDVSALGSGIHNIFLRTQNADSEWSQTSSMEFEIVLDFAYPNPPPAPTNIIAAEYFFDVDPGFGNGTDILPFTANQDVSFTNFSIDISSLNPGTHILFLRTQNNDGEWSLSGNRTFTIQAATDCTTTSVWNGSSWSNGVPDSTTKATIDGSFTLTADAEWCGLEILNGSYTINQGVKLTLNDTFDALDIVASTELNVEGIISSAGNIQNNGNILFKSTSAGTAQFDEFTSTISGAGQVTVERFIPQKRAFRLLSSPVTTTSFIYENWQQNGLNPGDSGYMANVGTQITGGNASLGFDQNSTGNPSMFTFDNTFVPTGAQTQFDAWTPLPNTNATKLNAEEPYLTMVRGDRSIDLTDNLDPATETTLSATGDLFTGLSSPVLSTGLGFYSLIANPYQAVVDYSLASRTDLTDFIYVWDADITGDNGRGGYVTVDVSGSTIPPNPFSSDASKFIPPGLSFFVQNLSSGPISSSLTFNEDDKATGENQVTVFNAYPNFYINSRLYLSSDYQNGHSERDAIGLRFSDNFTSLASDEDATKLGNPDENYAVVNNGLRSIDKQGLPNLGHEIELSITNYTETNYSLTFVMENKPEDLGVFLKDEYLGTQTELTESFVYNFSVDQNIPESIVESRFSLIFDYTTLGVNESTFGDNFSLYPNPTSDGIFSIKTPNLSGEVNIEITNLLGQQVYKQELSVESQQVNVSAENLSAGVYIVEMLHGKKTFVSKLIVK